LKKRIYCYNINSNSNGDEVVALVCKSSSSSIKFAIKKYEEKKKTIYTYAY
jgi:hypothetical protein